ncbi:MAG: putative metal-dependent hydrolase of the TIM-barrel fold [Frankiales bacterium]|nr:putative metal-dependent hydrolase of the TIM-barrel fold [Frankiales bacterium]
MIIDAHCHVWPDALASRVLATRPAGLAPQGDGTLSGLLRTMDAAGIDMACCLAIANVPEHVERTNAFTGAIDRSRFIPFGTVHTGLSVERNLAVLRNNGIRAVKFHPNFQNLSLGAPEVVELFTALADAGVVVLTHAGAGNDAAAHERGAPRHVRALVDAIPDLTLIACHYGGYHRLEEAEDAVLGSRVVLETSWPPSLLALGEERLRHLITQHGAHRFVFGSDWPMADPAAEIAVIRSLGLSAEDEAAVLGGTLAALLDVHATDPTRGAQQ